VGVKAFEASDSPIVFQRSYARDFVRSKESPYIVVAKIVIGPKINFGGEASLVEFFYKPEKPLRNEIRLSTGQVNQHRPLRFSEVEVDQLARGLEGGMVLICGKKIKVHEAVPTTPAAYCILKYLGLDGVGVRKAEHMKCWVDGKWIVGPTGCLPTVEMMNSAEAVAIGGERQVFLLF
jgi:hypothetical protein